MKLSFKIVSLLLSVLIVSLTVAGWAWIESERELLNRMLRNQGESISHAIAVFCIETVLSEDYVLLDAFVKTTGKETDDILLIEVLQQENTVVSTYRAENASEFDMVLFVSDIRTTANLSKVPRKLGKIRLGLRKKDQEIINARIRQLIVFILILFVVLFTAIMLVMKKVILEKIAVLSRNTRHLGEGQLETKIELKTNDEFGELARTINHMSEKILFSKKEIERQNKELKEAIDIINRSSTVVLLCENLEGWPVEYISANALELFGFPAEEFISKSVGYFGIIHADDLPIVREQIGENRNASIEDFSLKPYRIISKSGEFKWIENRIHVKKDKEGKITHYQGIVKDITKRKKAQEELKRTQNYLDNVVNSMPSMLIGVDAEERVTHWNKEAEKTTGISSDEAREHTLGKSFPRLASEMEKIRQVMKDKKPKKAERVVWQHSGETRFSDILVYPLVGNGIEGAVVRVDDITNRIQMETLMIQTEKMMSVGGLVAGMAHEINNTLAGIMQGAQNIRRRFSPDLRKNIRIADECGIDIIMLNAYIEKRDLSKLLDAVVRSGERAASIVRNMLLFSRKSESFMESNDLEELLETTIELASQDYDLERKFDFRKIEIVKDYRHGSESVSCVASEIEQVVLNLLKNAAYAVTEFEGTEKSRIVVRTSINGDMIRIEIEDNGPGMDESVKKRVFEPFFTTKPVGQGTGLGLSVSLMIVSYNHNGTLEVESELGKGTKFIIQLPIKWEGV